MNYDAKSGEYLQSKNDCAIVSIANLLKVDYARVIRELYLVGGTEAVLRLPKRGVNGPHIHKILENLSNTKVVYRTPKRGQDGFIGLASWHRPNRIKGHLTIIIGGTVKDTDGILYPSLEAYRVRFGFVLRGIYTFDV